MIEFTDPRADTHRTPPEVAATDESRVATCFAQLNSQERHLILEMERAARRVAGLLDEKESAATRSERRNREATLGTARAALIHTRHAVEASGLKRRLNGEQLAMLADCGTVSRAH